MARLVVGTGLYGRCDQIPNVGHVAHYFFHMGYSPLVPLRSVFVLDQDESEIKLPFSFKAMLFGYFRAFLLWCAFVTALVAFFALAGPVTLNLPSGPVELTSTIGYLAIGGVVAILVVLVLSYLIARPSQARTQQLIATLRQAGIQV
ncbi:MAG TPA: hypothetical protein VGK73_12015 [Polyangiaceae bacterium]